MKRYRTIFSTFHTIYRLTITSSNLINFLIGVGRLYKNAFKLDKVVIICKDVNTSRFIKILMENKKQYIKRGGISILTEREKEILKQEREIFLNNRLIYPFIFSDTLGAIYIKRNRQDSTFNELERRWFLSLCEEISICLKIFSLYHEAKKGIINYIKSLSRLLNQYVPTSYIHSRSALRLIRSLGKEMKLSKEEIQSLEYASILHDAGKIQLPSGLLKKQKPLTDEEFKIIQKHPRTGVELIKDLENLKPVVPIILHHHERYDGKGYPAGLKKEEIPLGSRILSVLDAFDAMFFGRPYKKRKYLDKIEEEFKKQKGKQFDPRIVEALLKILKRKSIKKFLHSFL